ncbi:glycosyltransferase [Aeoliella sp. SH292]|uniref:glycosyltransferase n=1 Tax=Aeoliella sp. SH292 TaxID=3454464 RepID=UPI003F957E8D
MRVLLYEPVPDGHHMADLSRLLPAILELPVEVILATVPETLEEPSFKLMLEPVLGRTQVETTCVRCKGSMFNRNWHQYRECAAMVKRYRPDHLYVMMGDAVWWLTEVMRLAGRRSWPREVTADTYLIRGGFTYPNAHRPVDRFRRFLFRRMLRDGHFDGILMLDEYGAEYGRHHAKPGDRGQVRLSPAPLVPQAPMSKHQARERLGLPVDGKLIAAIGMIGELRGVSYILNAFRRLSELRPDAGDRLLLAGPHDEGAHAALARSEFASLRAAGRILSIDRYLNDEEMFTCAAAPDVFANGTHNHAGRSSVIVWSAANGRPAVTTNTGSIGYVVESERLGWTCNVASANEFASTLKKALESPWTEADIDRVKAYASWHDIANYRAIGTQTLRQRLDRGGNT